MLQQDPRLLDMTVKVRIRRRKTVAYQLEIHLLSFPVLLNSQHRVARNAVIGWVFSLAAICCTCWVLLFYFLCKYCWDLFLAPGVCVCVGGGGISYSRARDSRWGVLGFDSRCGRPLPPGWVGVSIMCPAEAEVIISPLCLVCGST